MHSQEDDVLVDTAETSQCLSHFIINCDAMLIPKCLSDLIYYSINIFLIKHTLNEPSVFTYQNELLEEMVCVHSCTYKSVCVLLV